MQSLAVFVCQGRGLLLQAGLGVRTETSNSKLPTRDILQEIHLSKLHGNELYKPRSTFSSAAGFWVCGQNPRPIPLSLSVRLYPKVETSYPRCYLRCWQTRRIALPGLRSALTYALRQGCIVVASLRSVELEAFNRERMQRGEGAPGQHLWK